jgi:hypothetical protein
MWEMLKMTDVNYCQPLAAKFLSQVQFSQLSFETDSDYESFIQEQLIPAAMKRIDAYCNHDFQNNSGTVTLDGNGKDTLLIPPPYVPVQSVSSVTVSDAAATISNIKSYDTYIAYDGGNFTEDYQNIVVILSYGYTEIPADIEYACAQLVANVLIDLVRRKILPDMVAQAMQAQGGNANMLFASPYVFTPDIKEILDQYRYSTMSVA